MNKIHKTAIIEGDVELGDKIGISAYAVLRGDEGKIKVGSRSNIQEHCTLHGKGVSIGDSVTIGHGAILHGCRIGNNVLVGMGAIVMDGAEIGEWCIIGAGAVVTPGTKIEPGSLAVGLPAKVLRKLDEDDKKLIRKSAANYLRKLKG
ncbi:gamma carbonic anhydrase family protein [Candidatus Micrarchaeota archaeon]|nr:gamma carbonic anhydrase family protein [Candidatus Micrarchaeota archaeon]